MVNKVSDQYEEINDWIREAPDYDAQCIAIRKLLFRQEQTDQELEAQIDEVGVVAAGARGEANDRAVDEHVDLMHTATYQDAAHSMAAVGMIAPFTESMFRRLLGRDLERKNLRWKGIDKKIIVLLRERGLLTYLPDHLEPTLSALFAYRNNMFHNGFEWPREKCSEFETDIVNSPWPPDWFQKAMIDDDPWMFYMSPAFVEHCIQTMELIAKGINNFKLGIPAHEAFVADLDELDFLD